jgi:phage replication initiation protein
MKPRLSETIKRARMDSARAYADAACGYMTSIAKARPSVGPESLAGAGRTASAPALPERTGGAAKRQRLVPHLAQATAPMLPPINNMGENFLEHDGERWNGINDEHWGHVQLVMTDSGKVKTVMVRQPAEKQICIIDWVNFSVAEETWCRTAREQLISDEQFVCEASRQLEKIFGFGVTEKCKSGKNFFRESWVLGDGMGFVCFGGQRSKMGIILSGHGCLHALPGWEVRLYEFLTKVAIAPKISRIDLAHDDFDGENLSVEWASDQWASNGFAFREGGRPPEIQRLGNWDKPNGKGRTLTIGSRSSSKYVRFYEKGRKEGDKDSQWCRCEIEFKNTNTVIRPEVLLNPSEFFVGAYPCMAHFNRFEVVEAATRFEVKRRAAVINHDAAEKWLTIQCGKYIRVWRELYGDKEALDRLSCNDEDYWPKRLRVLTDSASSGPIPIHKQEPTFVPGFIHFVKTVPSFGLNGENGFM